MDGQWNDLGRRLTQASGSDAGLDAAVAKAFAQPEAGYTSSVEACRALVAAALPGWRLHLGYGVTGTFPYASLSRDGCHIVSDAPTVPLAILRSAVEAASSAPSSPPPA
ncbi:hypothetical protein [Magnetospirillum sp. SS-4]|uniref:hypothetical protein n=1 Tax=Magnetospirillum sp. SS-4 TaxID=2681465 RepID=UPI00137F1627|nr:hypothetical protein [Magnetospirillum sp. SS-4]CAA7626108.1 conserved hypothetical protein [Magnetospirillum sp. SS-4]